jgi:hypothetical protein
MKWIWLSTFLLFSFILPAQENCNLKIGTNLEGPTDYGSEWPFVNIFKLSRDWITHNHPNWSGGVPWDPWDTGYSSQVPRDTNGYPTHVPFEVEGADTVQVLRTVWANTMQLPTGVYVLLYDGQGRIDFWGDAQIISQSEGRLEVQVNGGMDAQDNIMVMEILESDSLDHIRNIRFLLPGTEDSYQQSPWAEEWIEKLEPFLTLRFMDWNVTNRNYSRNWEDRPQVSDATYTLNGIPYEWMIEICNRKQADAWICIPHLANEEYIREMATMFRDNLDPDLTIYVEYSNEVWNWIFPQTQYCHDSLDQNLPWPERIGPKIADVMQIWTEVFETHENRLIRVLGTQHGWFDIGRRIYLQIEADGKEDLIDAFSPAAYMPIDAQQLATLGASATAQDVISGAASFTFDPDEYPMEGWYQHAQFAKDNELQLLYYEGGQHFTPDPWGTVQPYNPALMAAQEAPEMYDLYQRLFDTLSQLTTDETLLMHFSFIAPLWEDPNEGAYGNFGSLKSQFHQNEPYDNAPKYRALVDHIEECESTTISRYFSELPLQVYPNPVHTDLFAVLEGPQAKFQWNIFDLLGRKVKEGHSLLNSGINVSDLSPGTYFFHIYVDQGVKRRKFIKL